MSYQLIRATYYNTNCSILQYNPTNIRTDVSLGVVGKLERLSAMVGEPNSDEKVIAKMNASFFVMNGTRGDTYSTLVDNGLYYHPSAPMYPTLILWKDQTMTIEHNPDNGRLAHFQGNALFAIGAGWTLLVDGKINYTYTRAELIKAFGHPWSAEPRTMIGQKADKTIVWVTTDGRNTGIYDRGWTIDEQADVMQRLGCVVAVSMDGGGSTEMIVDNKISNKLQSNYERSIGTAFFAYQKKTEEESLGGNVPPAIKSNKTGTVSASMLNVRSGPGTSYSVINRCYKNEKIDITGTSADGSWLYCAKGWVSGYYVSIAQIPSSTRVGLVTTALRLRQSYSTTSQILTVMPTNSKVPILDNSQKDWYKVEYNGYTGYAYAEYIKIL